MTTPTAGRASLIKVSATLAGSYTTVADVSSIDPSGFHLAQMYDYTRMGDTSARKASSGFFATKLVIGGAYDPSEAGMVILLANMSSGAMGVQYLPNGSTGYKQEMVVTDFKLTAAPGSDALKFSITLESAAGTAPASV